MYAIRFRFAETIGTEYRVGGATEVDTQTVTHTVVDMAVSHQNTLLHITTLEYCNVQATVERTGTETQRFALKIICSNTAS